MNCTLLEGAGSGLPTSMPDDVVDERARAAGFGILSWSNGSPSNNSSMSGSWFSSLPEGGKMPDAKTVGGLSRQLLRLY